MPRKQNGWGAPKGLAFKPLKNVTTGKGQGAAGYYPSSRRYGTTVSRSVIEKYDMDSDWVKWRKGYEYYVKAAYDVLQVPNPFVPGEYVRAELSSVLYQGSEYELPVSFYGWEFPTSEGDVNTHYVAKREPDQPALLGQITEVWNNAVNYPKQYANKEIWCKGIPNINARLLLQMQGERLTDGVTEATLKTVLTEDERPAVYTGKTFPSSVVRDDVGLLDATTVVLRIPVGSIDHGTQTAGNTYETSGGLRSFTAKDSAEEILSDTSNLIGKIIYVPDFYVEKPISELDAIVWGDATDYFGAVILDTVSGAKVYCLEPDAEQLPPSMYDIKSLPTVFSSDSGVMTVQGTYIFRKEDYQRFFPDQYLSGESISGEVSDLSYALLPFTIAEAVVVDGLLTLTSVPFASEVKMHPELTESAILIFTENSFTNSEQNGEWVNVYTDVQPWQDEVFTSGNPLEPAITYTCSCPNHSHALLGAPQMTESDGIRKNNRQRKYPLPTVQGISDWDALGSDYYSGKLVSWETPSHRLGFKLCKHSIAARFSEKVKIIEPSSYPSIETRLKFEAELEEEIARFASDFKKSYRRSQISLGEIVFALAQGLNLDQIETAYVMLNA